MPGPNSQPSTYEYKPLDYKTGLELRMSLQNKIDTTKQNVKDEELKALEEVPKSFLDPTATEGEQQRILNDYKGIADQITDQYSLEGVTQKIHAMKKSLYANPDRNYLENAVKGEEVVRLWQAQNPNGYSPLDKMTIAERKEAGVSNKDWVNDRVATVDINNEAYTIHSKIPEFMQNVSRGDYTEAQVTTAIYDQYTAYKLDAQKAQEQGDLGKLNAITAAYNAELNGQDYEPVGDMQIIRKSFMQWLENNVENGATDVGKFFQLQEKYGEIPKGTSKKNYTSAMMEALDALGRTTSTLELSEEGKKKAAKEKAEEDSGVTILGGEGNTNLLYRQTIKQLQATEADDNAPPAEKRVAIEQLDKVNAIVENLNKSNFFEGIKNPKVKEEFIDVILANPDVTEMTKFWEALSSYAGQDLVDAFEGSAYLEARNRNPLLRAILDTPYRDREGILSYTRDNFLAMFLGIPAKSGAKDADPAIGLDGALNRIIIATKAPNDARRMLMAYGTSVAAGHADTAEKLKLIKKYQELPSEERAKASTITSTPRIFRMSFAEKAEAKRELLLAEIKMSSAIFITTVDGDKRQKAPIDPEESHALAGLIMKANLKAANFYIANEDSGPTFNLEILNKDLFELLDGNKADKDQFLMKAFKLSEDNLSGQTEISFALKSDSAMLETYFGNSQDPEMQNVYENMMYNNAANSTINQVHYTGDDAIDNNYNLNIQNSMATASQRLGKEVGYSKNIKVGDRSLGEETNIHLEEKTVLGASGVKDFHGTVIRLDGEAVTVGQHFNRTEPLLLKATTTEELNAVAPEFMSMATQLMKFLPEEREKRELVEDLIKFKQKLKNFSDPGSALDIEKLKTYYDIVAKLRKSVESSNISQKEYIFGNSKDVAFYLSDLYDTD